MNTPTEKPGMDGDHEKTDNIGVETMPDPAETPVGLPNTEGLEDLIEDIELKISGMRAEDTHKFEIDDASPEDMTVLKAAGADFENGATEASRKFLKGIKDVENAVNPTMPELARRGQSVAADILHGSENLETIARLEGLENGEVDPKALEQVNKLEDKSELISRKAHEVAQSWKNYVTPKVSGVSEQPATPPAESTPKPAQETILPEESVSPEAALNFPPKENQDRDEIAKPERRYVPEPEQKGGIGLFHGRFGEVVKGARGYIGEKAKSLIDPMMARRIDVKIGKIVAKEKGLEAAEARFKKQAEAKDKKASDLNNFLASLADPNPRSVENVVNAIQTLQREKEGLIDKSNDSRLKVEAIHNKRQLFESKQTAIIERITGRISEKLRPHEEKLIELENKKHKLEDNVKIYGERVMETAKKLEVFETNPELKKLAKAEYSEYTKEMERSRGLIFKNQAEIGRLAPRFLKLNERANWWRNERTKFEKLDRTKETTSKASVPKEPIPERPISKEPVSGTAGAETASGKTSTMEKVPDSSNTLENKPGNETKSTHEKQSAPKTERQSGKKGVEGEKHLDKITIKQLRNNIERWNHFVETDKANKNFRENPKVPVIKFDHEVYQELLEKKQEVKRDANRGAKMEKGTGKSHEAVVESLSVRNAKIFATYAEKFVKGHISGERKERTAIMRKLRQMLTTFIEIAKRRRK